METGSGKAPINWLAVVILTLAALPFLWGTAYMSYRSLWFHYGAARAEGTVVGVTGRTPTLTVEFKTAGGEMRRTESGGSDLYKGIAKGDRLTVFYDPQRPGDARLDLWVENWLLPLVTAVPGSIILLAMVLINSSLRRNPFAKPTLKAGGTLVQAEFVRVRVGVDMDRASDARRMPGEFTLTEEDGRTELVHNGQKRDPYDPAVQRELGLCYIVEAKGKDPVTGGELVFESDPLDSNPERLLQGRTIPVYVDPKRPAIYRMELPFQKRSSQASPIIKV
jgi:hypothetical protein